MTDVTISLNQKFRELLMQVGGNTVGRKHLIALAENTLQLSNIQAQRFVARNIHVLTTQRLIVATSKKNTRFYLITPELLAILQQRVGVKMIKDFVEEEASPNELIKEEMKTCAELKLILGEIQAYQDYLIKFPQSNKTILSLLNKTRERASDFYGRLSAIKKIIKATEIEDKIAC